MNPPITATSNPAKENSITIHHATPATGPQTRSTMEKPSILRRRVEGAYSEDTSPRRTRSSV